MIRRAALRQGISPRVPLRPAPLLSGTPPARISVRLLDTTGHFAALGFEWNRLHERAAAASVFNSWCWQYHWWERYGRDGSLRILAASEGGETVGILPLHLQAVPMLGLRVRVLRLVGTGGDTYPDDLGPVLGPGSETIVADALAHAALRMEGFDVLELSDLDSRSPFPAAVTRACGQAHMACVARPAEKILYVELPGAWEAFLATLSAQRRQRIRRLRRKLAATHGVRFYVLEDPAALDGTVDRLVELHRQRWQWAGEAHSFSSPQYVQFHRDVIKACFLRGWLRLYCLEIAGRVAAILYTYRFRNGIYLMQAGFDPAYAGLSIGTVLFGYALEHAITEGNQVFDFLRGEHEYKTQLATASRETLAVTALRPGLAALAYRAEQFDLPAWRAACRAFLRRRGVIPD